MFNMNRRYNRLIVALIVALIVVPIQIKHSTVSYRWVIYQNTIGVVMHRLVGMGLTTFSRIESKFLCSLQQSRLFFLCRMITFNMN